MRKLLIAVMTCKRDRWMIPHHRKMLEGASTFRRMFAYPCNSANRPIAHSLYRRQERIDQSLFPSQSVRVRPVYGIHRDRIAKESADRRGARFAVCSHVSRDTGNGGRSNPASQGLRPLFIRPQLWDASPVSICYIGTARVTC